MQEAGIINVGAPSFGDNDENDAANDDTFKPDNFPSASDAFGDPEDDNDVPF